MKKIIFILAIFFLPYYFLYAGIEINEIMYDLKTGSDDGREWIEIFNNSDTEVDLSSFKFFEGDTNHKLKIAQGDAKISAQSYAIIVSNPTKFKIDWPNFSGVIFDSTFSLSNSGENLIIKNGDVVVYEFNYKSSLGGAGDGKSLQKINPVRGSEGSQDVFASNGINGVWQGSVPSPGKENKIVYAPPFKASFTKKIELDPKTNSLPEITTPPLAPLLNQGGGGGGNFVTNIIPENNNYPYLFIIIFIFFLGGSGGAVYFFRQKKFVPRAGDDFEILDE